MPCRNFDSQDMGYGQYMYGNKYVYGALIGTL